MHSTFPSCNHRPVCPLLSCAVQTVQLSRKEAIVAQERAAEAAVAAMPAERDAQLLQLMERLHELEVALHIKEEVTTMMETDLGRKQQNHANKLATADRALDKIAEKERSGKKTACKVQESSLSEQEKGRGRRQAYVANACT